MKKGLLIIMVLLSSTALFGQREKKHGWSLVYANDENGNKTAGDIKRLIQAIRNGESIRIGWTITFEHPTLKNLKVEHFADAKFITILSDTVVFTQIDPIVGQEPGFKEKFITLSETEDWTISASSLGNNDIMYMNRKTGETKDHNPWKCGIKWFVNKV